MKTLILLALIGLAVAIRPMRRPAGPNVPTFTQSYTVDGLLQLPYAEIKEPFVAYFDSDNGRSRVDYYGDLVQTVQRGDVKSGGLVGVSYKLAWMVDTSGAPQRVCFQQNGTSDNPVTTTSVLPDLTGFTYVGQDYCPLPDGTPNGPNNTCERWESTVTVEEKTSKYTFWNTRDKSNNAVPVFYLMKGYDSLLGSHYDEYKVAYSNYAIGAIDPNVFKVTDAYTCRGFPGPGNQQLDPISEFIHGKDEHIDTEFDRFKTKHGKSYQDPVTHQQKKNIFRHNYRFIQSQNRKNKHMKLKVNHLADMTPQEMRSLRGRLYTPGYNGGKEFVAKNVRSDIPDQFDWRLYGAVNPVKDQAVCGSCWSFGTTGTLEGTYFVKTGKLLRLSEQQLMDCSWQQGNNACDGGEDFRAYDYIMSVGGLSLDEDYGGYLGQDGKCHDRSVKFALNIDGFVNVTTNSPEALELALFENGPVTVAIDASQRTLSFYSNGVYYDSNCGNKPEDLDHQVLAVGYGEIYGEKYWLIKNSWSTYWGNDGYVLMAQKDNNCGVMTSPTYPTYKD